MNITEYIDLVMNTKRDVFCKEELMIENDFDATSLLKLCSSDLLNNRLKLAWDMIVSAVEKNLKVRKRLIFF